MADLEWKSDLLLGVMNLIEAEHHARFTFCSTKNEIWIDIINEIREIRTKYMAQVEKELGGQSHCFNKHILSASFRLFEVGDKFLAEGKSEESKNYYNDGYSLLETFIKLNWLGNTNSFLKKIGDKIYGDSI